MENGYQSPGFVGATTIVKAPSWRTQVNTPEDPVSVNSRDMCFKYAYLGGQAGQARLERDLDLEHKDQACLPKPRNTRTQQGERTTCKGWASVQPWRKSPIRESVCTI